MPDHDSKEPSTPVDLNRPPVLPYRAGKFARFRSPVDEVFGQMGMLALGLAVVALSVVTAALVAPGVVGRSTGGLGFVCAGLSWIFSLTIALVVASRASIGRKWAVLAVLADLLSLGMVICVTR